MPGWQRGRPGQASFVTDQHRVIFREFGETMFESHGTDKPTAPCGPTTVTELGYRPSPRHH